MVILDGSQWSLALRESDIKHTWSAAPHHSGTWFISMVVQSLQQGLLSSLLPIIKYTCQNFTAGVSRNGTLAFRDMSLAGFLGDMCQSLQDASSLLDEEDRQNLTPIKPVSADDVKAVFEEILRHGVLKPMPTRQAVDDFPGWAIASRGCGKRDCVDCAVLDALLGHETAIVAHFNEWSLRSGVDHLIGQLTKRTAEWPAPFEYSIKGEIGSRTVTLTKQERVLRERVQHSYEYAMRSLRRRVAPLKNEYMKQVLGRELYGELVLLGEEDEEEATECDQCITDIDFEGDSDSTQTCSDAAQLSTSSIKRPAPSSPDTGSMPKRLKTD